MSGFCSPGWRSSRSGPAYPFAGVLPWLPDVWLDAEDTLEVASWRRDGADGGALRVAVVRLPRMSNGTDVEALAAEPGVDVQVTTDPRAVAACRSCGAARQPSNCQRSRLAAPYGTCQGDHGSGRPRCARAGDLWRIPDAGASGSTMPIESGRGPVTGLDVLPVQIGFGADKMLGRPLGVWRGHQVQAYEIHHGVAQIAGEAEPFLDGCRQGQVWGTMWHGAFENDDFRRAWLAEIASAVGSDWRSDPDAPGYAARRETMIDTLADAVEQHVDLGLAAGRHSSGYAAVTIQALVIGIGSGNPDHLTREAVAALNRVDVFLVADKGAAKHDLVQLREEICSTVITHDHYRFVEVPDPERGPDRDRDAADYQAGVAAWHEARAQPVCRASSPARWKMLARSAFSYGGSCFLRLHNPHPRVNREARD